MGGTQLRVNKTLETKWNSSIEVGWKLIKEINRMKTNYSFDKKEREREREENRRRKTSIKSTGTGFVYAAKDILIFPTRWRG